MTLLANLDDFVTEHRPHGITRRRLLVAGLAISLVANPGRLRAQPAAGKWRIGALFRTPRPDPGGAGFEYWDALMQGLRERGYVEGQNVVFEYAYSDGDPDRRAREAARLVATRPDIIVAAVGLDGLAVRKVTSTIPIVVAVGADLVGQGLVASLARPGGNVTGSQFLSPELAGKRLELLKLVAPKVKHVGLVHGKSEGIGVEAFRERLLSELEAAARALKIQVKEIAIDSVDDLDRVLENVREQGVDALFIRASPFTNQNRQRLLELGARHVLPVISDVAEWARDGALMSYGANLPDLFRRAATFVDRILKGVRPADLPVEQPTKFELVINLKTAKGLGLTIPQAVLGRVDEVVQ